MSTRETENKIAILRSQLEVMEAFKNGKTIQFKKLLPANEKWRDSTTSLEPGWFWKDYDYRVKPEPREVYVSKPQLDRKKQMPLTITKLEFLNLSESEQKYFVLFREVDTTF